MDLIQVIDHFLKQYCPSNQPLLLGLSGGADSLCLFHCLLACHQKYPFSFHVAHVDHGWRLESQAEVLELEKMAAFYGIPFHHKKLNPHTLTGNLEAACRVERYSFFKELCNIYAFQGVLVGHQADDQAETVLKRLLEGTHWSKLGALTPEVFIYGIRLLRPLLSISKKDIYLWLAKHHFTPFEDRTNRDSRFLRARMRQTLIPLLNQEFGKQVQQSLIHIGEEAQELRKYFDDRVAPLLSQIVRGPLGIYLDLQKSLPETELETKYLLRRLCEQEGFFLSRPLIELAVQLLRAGQANRTLTIGLKIIRIDRYRIFISNSYPLSPFDYSLLLPGLLTIGNWRMEVKIIENPIQAPTMSWQDGWQAGEWRTILPMDDYLWGPAISHASYRSKSHSISKWWTDHKVPAFLRSIFPVIWKGTTIYHEFLTGQSIRELKIYQNWVAVKVNFFV